MVKIPASYVDWIKAGNIQHIEVVFTSKGIFAYGNGKRKPYLAWDDDSLGLAAELAGAVGVPNVASLESLMRWMRRYNLDIVVQLPVADGAEIIPYRDTRSSLLDTAVPPEAPREEIRLHVRYNNDGVPTIIGSPAATLRGYKPPRVDREFISQMKQAGVRRLAVQTRWEQMFIFVNNRPRPNVAWSTDQLISALGLYQNMHPDSWATNAAFVNMVRQVVLEMTDYDFHLVVDFP
jgi:hypothetical protein